MRSEYVDFTAPSSFNALAVRFSIPDAPTGGGLSAQIGLSVDGVALPPINVSSAHSWLYGAYPFTNDPKDGKPHHFFDEARVKLPSSAVSGARISLTMLPAGPDPAEAALPANCSALPIPRRRDCGFDGVTPAQCTARGCCYDPHPAPNPQHHPYCFHIPAPPSPPAPFTLTVDLIDLYTVPDPFPPPPKALSVVDHGADPTGQKDSKQAFEAALKAASRTGASVYAPAGEFLILGHLIMPQHQGGLFGAGPWHTTLRGGRTVPTAVGVYAAAASVGGSQGMALHDLAIVGDIRERVDNDDVNGVGGAPTAGSVIQNVFIHHTKCGVWINGPGTGLLVTDMIVRDTMADGINLHGGWESVTIERSSFRNQGDDSIALWSDTHADAGNTIRDNLIQLPILANGIAIYGGRDNTVAGNLVADTVSNGGGIHVGNRFDRTVPLAGTTIIDRNTVVRCGSLESGWGFANGAIWFYALNEDMDGNVTVTNTAIVGAPYAALMVVAGHPATSVSNLHLRNVTIDRAGTFALVLKAAGSLSARDVTLGSSAFQRIEDCGSKFALADLGGNGDWLKQCTGAADCGANASCQGQEWSLGTRFCAHCGFPPPLKLDDAYRAEATRLDLSTPLDSATALRHDGIGIIADATTKLLYSYDEPYRGQIIDWFFKPQFGASLDMLKVEVGGDGQNTLGTSSSHQHTKDEAPDFSRGMLWWLMEQVKQRNDRVLFYGLPWCYPGFVGSPYSEAAADYLATWLDGAKRRNVSVSYIGVSQNEHAPCAKTAADDGGGPRCVGITEKRAAFNKHGHRDVKIVAPDAFDCKRSRLPLRLLPKSKAELLHSRQEEGRHGDDARCIAGGLGGRGCGRYSRRRAAVRPIPPAPALAHRRGKAALERGE